MHGSGLRRPREIQTRQRCPGARELRYAGTASFRGNTARPWSVTPRRSQDPFRAEPQHCRQEGSGWQSSRESGRAVVPVSLLGELHLARCKQWPAAPAAGTSAAAASAPSFELVGGDPPGSLAGTRRRVLRYHLSPQSWWHERRFGTGLLKVGWGCAHHLRAGLTKYMSGDCCAALHPGGHTRPLCLVLQSEMVREQEMLQNRGHMTGCNQFHLSCDLRTPS